LEQAHPDAARSCALRNPREPPAMDIRLKLLTWLKEPNDYESVGRAFESPGAHHFEPP